METTHSKKILIVDDDSEICSLLSAFLQKQGFSVSSAANTSEADTRFKEQEYDLLVLDLMMPGEDGLSYCRRLRGHSGIPIIMLTAMGEETDRIVGLELGADDYLPKPFNPRELLARIKAVLRRQHPPQAAQGDQVHFEGWHLDLAKRELTQTDGTLLCLTAGEFELLAAFVEHPQQVLSRDRLMDMTKGRGAGPFDRSIDVQLSRLRKKMEHDPKDPKLFKTVRSGGYLFTAHISRSK
ncbi:MAG: response regulator [Gammaproteobacteria bacterium]|nr:response regulator [Gammaproteobacteria bacterium]MDH5799466.1 response regulator [Gammaproteobacteria bacterium]